MKYRYKKRLLVMVFLTQLVIMIVSSQTVTAAGNTTIENRSDHTLCDLYVSPVEFDYWWPDLLDGESLAPNAQIDFTPYNGSGTYDVFARACDGTVVAQRFYERVDEGNVYAVDYNTFYMIQPTSSPTPAPSPPPDQTAPPCPAQGTWPPGCTPATPPSPPPDQTAPPCPTQGTWPPGCVPPSPDDDPPPPLEWTPATFTLHNQSQNNLCGLYLTLPSQPTWGHNYLESPLSQNTSTQIIAPSGVYNIIISTCTGMYLEFPNQTIIDGIELFYNGNS